MSSFSVHLGLSPCSHIQLKRLSKPQAFSCLQFTTLQRNLNAGTTRPLQARKPGRGCILVCKAELKALIWDCDGVILESENLHRIAYNAAFTHFNVSCTGGPVVDWTVEFYDMLQNKVGGGIPKMRWYFGENGWPTSSVLPAAPTTDEERTLLVETLQAWKSTKFQQLIGSGEVLPRPGVLRLMDEARATGLKVAVCSAATKSSCVFTVSNLLGPKRFEALDVFLAGDDVPKLKPDPTIYRMALEKLSLSPSECIVIEDSNVGLQAALGAGMRCVITATSSTKDQPFGGASLVVESLGDDPALVTLDTLRNL